MQRVLAAAVFLLGLICLAQAQMNTLGIGGAARGVAAPVLGCGGTGYQGPGDVVSGATSFYGLRAYNCVTAQNKVMVIRRISDGVFADVHTLQNGSLDTTSASTFCTGTTCTVPIIYDQTNNGHDVVQVTPAYQPRLSFSCLGAKPCLVFNGFYQFAVGNVLGAIPLPFSTVWVAERTAAFTSSQAVASISATFNDYTSGWASSANGGLLSCGGINLGPTQSDSTWHTRGDICNSTAVTAYVDGVSTAGGAGSGPGIRSDSVIALGVLNQGPQAYFSGNSSEFGFWTISFTGLQATHLCQNQQAFYGAGNFGAAC
jgi:hypothetical protein